jgi:hypothetical protein
VICSGDARLSTIESLAAALFTEIPEIKNLRITKPYREQLVGILKVLALLRYHRTLPWLNEEPSRATNERRAYFTK